ncbi:unnamed protein product [Symbiodinium sp. CCMP2456]|nr:unnamed protein product [Symbiodinium sp. CCMP2456]
MTSMELELDVVAESPPPPREQSDEEGADGSEAPNTSNTSRSSKRKRDGLESVDDKSGAAKAAASSKNAALLGLKKATKVNNRRCKVCGLHFRPEGMGSKAPYCIRCKSKVDQVSRLARSQGRKEWFSDLRGNEAKLAKVVAKYRELAGDDGDGPGAVKKQKAGQTGVSAKALFEVLDKHLAGSRVSFDSELLQWKSLIEEQPDTEELVWDRKGKDGALRVGISVADMVRLSNFKERSKEFTEKKTEKNLDSVAIAGHKKWLTSGDGRDEEAVVTASKIVRSGSAGDCFSGRGYDIDVGALDSGSEELEPEPMVKRAASEGDGDADTAEGDKSSTSSPKKPDPQGKAKAKAKKWDRDTVIAAKIRAEQTAILQMEVAVQGRLKDCRAALAEAAAKGSVCAEETKVEQTTLEKRVRFLSAVMEKTEDELQALINQYDDADSSAEAPGSVPLASGPAPAVPTSAATVATSWASQLTNAPPCENFRALKTLASSKDTVDDLWQATTANELKDLAKHRVSGRKPITELNQACNTGLRELKKALTSFDQRAKTKTAGAAATAKGKKTPPSIFESGLEFGTAVPEVQDVKAVDVSLPCLIKLTEEQVALLSTDCVNASGEQFCAAFATHVKNHTRGQVTKHPDARTKARAACKAQPEAAEVWTQLLGSLGNLVMPLDGFACMPYHVGVEGSSVTASNEQDFLASVRAVTKGTRTILAMPYSLAVEVFGSSSPSSLWSKLVAASEEQLKALSTGKGAKKLYIVTHGVGEVLYMPQGWLFAERVTKVDCHAMMSRGVVLRNAESALAEIEVVQMLLTGAQNDKDCENIKKIRVVLENAMQQREHDRAAAAAAAAGAAAKEAAQVPVDQKMNPEVATVKENLTEM